MPRRSWAAAQGTLARAAAAIDRAPAVQAFFQTLVTGLFNAGTVSATRVARAMVLAGEIGDVARLADFDVVVVPALGTLTAAATNDVLQSRDARSVIASLGRLDEATTRIAAACTGVFAVA